MESIAPLVWLSTYCLWKLRDTNVRELLFIYLFICLFIFPKSLNDSRGFVRTPDLSFSAWAKPFLWVLLSIILFTCPFFSGAAGMSTKFGVHNVFHLSESRKKSQFHPFSTTTNFRFKSLRTVFIISIHFIFLEPRLLLQSGSGRKK